MARGRFGTACPGYFSNREGHRRLTPDHAQAAELVELAAHSLDAALHAPEQREDARCYRQRGEPGKALNAAFWCFGQLLSLIRDTFDFGDAEGWHEVYDVPADQLRAAAATYDVPRSRHLLCVQKATVEPIANALRLELTPSQGGGGSAHSTWLDTYLVRDSEELRSVKDARGRLRGPLGGTGLAGGVCASARGCERQAQAARVRPVVSRCAAGPAPAGARCLRRRSPQASAAHRGVDPALEDAVAALGRAFGATSAVMTPAQTP